MVFLGFSLVFPWCVLAFSWFFSGVFHRFPYRVSLVFLLLSCFFFVFSCFFMFFFVFLGFSMFFLVFFMVFSATLDPPI